MTRKKCYFGFRPKYSSHMELGFSVFIEQTFSRRKFRHLLWYRRLRSFKVAHTFGKVDRLPNVVDHKGSVNNSGLECYVSVFRKRHN